MAQGKLKVKAKLPAKAKTASVHRGTSNIQKSKGIIILYFLLYFGTHLSFFSPFVFLVIKKKGNSASLAQKLQNEVTKEIRKNIEESARGAANKFGVSTKMDRKKK